MYQLLNKVNFNPNFDFTKNLIAKDFSKQKILKLRPELEAVITQLEHQLERKKYLTIDFTEKALKTGHYTCKRPIWHVDGIGNNYALVCWGEFRTLFLKNEIEFKRHETIKETSDEINSLVFKNKNDFFELESNQPILYSSNVIHSGRVATHEAKRVLLRLCFSDYIKPANVILK